MSESRSITDINSLQLEDDDLVIDPNADPDTRQVPPEGKYIVKLGINEGNGSAYTSGVDKRGRSYVMLNLVGTIVADGSPFNNMKVFDSRSTLVLDSSGTCGLMAIPRALGLKVPARS